MYLTDVYPTDEGVVFVSSIMRLSDFKTHHPYDGETICVIDKAMIREDEFKYLDLSAMPPKEPDIIYGIALKGEEIYRDFLREMGVDDPEDLIGKRVRFYYRGTNNLGISKVEENQER